MSFPAIENYIKDPFDYKAGSLEEELKRLSSDDLGENSKKLKKLKEACIDFEAIFIEKLWNEMKKTLPKGGLFEDKILENYLSIFDMEFARSLAQKGGIGLGEMLYENLKTTLEEKSRWIEPRSDNKVINPKKLEKSSFKEFLHKIRTIHQVEDLANKLKNKKDKNDRNDSSFIMPVHGKISSHFGWRIDPFTHKWAWHNGIDIAAPVGTPVRSFGDGKVLFAGERGGFGNLIIIQHSNGLKTYYGHLSKIIVKKGQIVKKGEVIGKVGATGRATGPHLHFEVRLKDKAIDPEHLKKEFAKLKVDVIT